MAKTRNRIISLLFFLTCSLGVLHSQNGFNFSGDKVKSARNLLFNADIKNALDKNDLKKMKRLLSKKPDLVNSAVEESNMSKYNRFSSRKKPLIFAALERYMSNKISLELLDLIFEFDPNTDITYNDKTFIYILLDYLNSDNVEVELFQNVLKLLTNNGIDINRKLSGLPPPFSYLITNSNYLPTSTINRFVESGASIHTRDTSNNSLLIISAKINDNSLFEYSLAKKLDIEAKNSCNNDVLYYAILNQNLEQIRRLLKEGYPLNEDRILEVKIPKVIVSTSEDIKDLLFDILKTGSKTFSQMKTLVMSFPSRSNYFIEEGFERSRFLILKSEIPDFISLFDIENNNIENLKKEYVYSFDNIKSFNVAAEKYTEVGIILPSYREDYYIKEQYSDSLLSDLKSLKNILPKSLYLKLHENIIEETEKYFNNSLDIGTLTTLATLKEKFPSKKGIIENKAYALLSRIPSGNEINLNTLDYEYLRKQVKRMKWDIASCDMYINNFSQAIEIARRKRLEIYQNTNRVSKRLTVLYGIRDDLMRRHRNIIKKIEDYGAVPPYRITNVESLKNSTRYTVRINVLLNDITIDKDSRGQFSVITGSFSSSKSAKSYDMDKTIRLYFIVERMNISFFSNLLSFELKLVPCLEKNIKGEWWKCDY